MAVAPLLTPAQQKEADQRKSSMEAIEFYMKHLETKDLLTLEFLAQKLAETHSESYREWKYRG
jgi:hypothetical protein